jgi:hypothetical protein
MSAFQDHHYGRCGSGLRVDAAIGDFVLLHVYAPIRVSTEADLGKLWNKRILLRIGQRDKAAGCADGFDLDFGRTVGL